MNYQMENSSFGPSNPHPAAALVAFTQANSNLSEALRLSRPFPQVTHPHMQISSHPPFISSQQNKKIFFF